VNLREILKDCRSAMERHSAIHWDFRREIRMVNHSD
jgi:hypothetical protein